MLKFYTILPDNDDLGGARQPTKISILLQEINENFETIDLDRHNQVRPLNSEYRKSFNPNGRVPTIDDNGFILWEVGAILNYIIATRPAAGAMKPADPRKAAICDQWLYWEGTTFTPDLIAWLTLLSSTDPSFVAADLDAMVLAAGGAPFLLIGRDKEADRKALAQASDMMLFNLGLIDRTIGEKPYVLGQYSVVDIALGVVTAICFKGDIDMRPFANICRWLKLLAERPSFQNTPSFVDHMEIARRTNRI